MTDTINVQVIFEKTAPDGTVYRDALYFAVDEYEKMKQADIDAAKQQRFDNWQKAIEDAKNAPAPAVEPVEASDLQSLVDTTQEALNALASQVALLQGS